MADITPEEVAANNTTYVSREDVPIVVHNPDVNSSSDITGDLEYTEGGAVVEFTAPLTFEKFSFKEWVITNTDTLVETTQPNVLLQLLPDANYVAKAIYKSSQIGVNAELILGVGRVGQDAMVPTNDMSTILGRFRVDTGVAIPTLDCEFLLGVTSPSTIVVEPSADVELSIV